MTVLSTPDSSLRRDLAFERFQALATSQFVPLHVHSDDPDGFRGGMRGRSIDEVEVVEVSAGAHTVERTAADVARGGTDRYKLTVQLSGTGLLVQDDREAVIRPGDIALYDTGRPYSLIFDGDCRILVFMLPRRLLRLPVDHVGQLTAVRFDAAGAVGSVVGPLLTQLGSVSPMVSTRTGQRLTYGALELVTTMLADELDQRPAAHDPHEQLMARIYAYIDDHLGDPRLSPLEVASAVFISPRHLHSLFHARDTTVSTYIRSQRLERCRRDLIDPLYAAHPVGWIASRWGLPDAAHFSRVFRATFGVAPSDYRSAAA